MTLFDTTRALKKFIPRSQLIVQQTEVLKPICKVIDAHNHLGQAFGGGWSERDVRELLDILDEANVDVYVDLDGGWDETILDQRLEKYKNVAPDRFCFFGSPGWKNWRSDGDAFGERSARRLRDQVRRGAQGLKIWKDFGLSVRDHQGSLVAIDDQRLIPLWETAGELSIPVMIHIADPVAFFDPLNFENERLEELDVHRDWHFPAPQYPKFSELIGQFEALVARHKNTNFIGAHVGCYSENLIWVSNLMERCSNFYVDISARISELGRQPYSSIKFFERHQDRILFGIDAGPDLAMYRIYWRFLETQDEYFDYSPTKTPTQGRWKIYGLGLRSEILQKIYFHNANILLNLNRPVTF